MWAGQPQRHGGDIDLGAWNYRSAGYAVTGRAADLDGVTGGLSVLRPLLGTIRIRVTPSAGAGPLFVGIAPAPAVRGYLTGVRFDTADGITHHQVRYTAHRGGAPATPPGQAGLWAAQATGPGRQALSFPARDGSWLVVAMNADGSRPVSVRMHVAATLPSLLWIATGLLAGGVLLLAAGTILVVFPVRRAASSRRASARHDHSP